MWIRVIALAYQQNIAYLRNGYKWLKTICLVNLSRLCQNRINANLRISEITDKQTANYEGHLQLISPTFYAQLFRTKVLRKCVLYILGSYFWRKNIGAKAARKSWWNGHLYIFNLHHNFKIECYNNAPL